VSRSWVQRLSRIDGPKTKPIWQSGNTFDRDVRTWPKQNNLSSTSDFDSPQDTMGSFGIFFIGFRHGADS
jgi:hypothetical protein